MQELAAGGGVGPLHFCKCRLMLMAEHLAPQWYAQYRFYLSILVGTW